MQTASARSFSLVLLPLSLSALAACATPVPDAPSGRAVGAACAFDAQCASRRCSADVPGGGCGICVQVRKLGERCDGPQQGCNVSAVCREGVCQTTKKNLGEACSLGALYEDIHECDDELYCKRATDQGVVEARGVCTGRVALGGACSRGTAGTCAQGTFCNLEGRCAVPREGSCEGGSCEAGHFCDDNLLCQPSTLPEGARCGVVDGDLVNNDCAPGTVCGSLDWPEGGGGQDAISTCVPLPLLGDVCISGQCAEGLFCAAQSADSMGVVHRRCEHRRQEGAACDTNPVFPIECGPSLECRAGTCERACH